MKQKCKKKSFQRYLENKTRFLKWVHTLLAEKYLKATMVWPPKHLIQMKLMEMGYDPAKANQYNPEWQVNFGHFPIEF